MQLPLSSISSQPKVSSSIFQQQSNEIPGLGDLIPGLGGELPSSPEKGTLPWNAGIHFIPLPECQPPLPSDSIPFAFGEPAPVPKEIPTSPLRPSQSDLPPERSSPSVTTQSENTRIQPLMQLHTSQSHLVPSVLRTEDKILTTNAELSSNLMETQQDSQNRAEQPVTAVTRKAPLSERLMTLADYSFSVKSEKDSDQTRHTDEKPLTRWVRDPQAAAAEKSQNLGTVLFNSRDKGTGLVLFSSKPEFQKETPTIPGLETVLSDPEEEPEITTVPVTKISQVGSEKVETSEILEVSPAEEVVTTEDEGSESNDDDIEITAMRAQLILGMKRRQERKIQQLDVS